MQRSPGRNLGIEVVLMSSGDEDETTVTPKIKQEPKRADGLGGKKAAERKAGGVGHLLDKMKKDEDVVHNDPVSATYSLTEKRLLMDSLSLALQEMRSQQEYLYRASRSRVHGLSAFAPEV
jgi:hypothetical protein